jgi:type I restriction enzyme M protein
MPAINNEEDVKIHYLPSLLTAAGYSLDRVQYNVPIEVKQGRKKRTIFADAVVYEDAACTKPLVVVETKPPVPLEEGDADQAFSYARLLPEIAPVVLLTNGKSSGTKVYDTYSKKVLPKLPSPTQVVARRVKAIPPALVAEAKHELFKVDSVQEYKRILRASHNVIRNNEGYDPTKAFDELSKVMFTKLYEEKSGKDRFTVKKFDQFLGSNVNIIQQVFSETMKDADFEGLFAAGDRIDLTDRTIRDLVAQFEGYDLSLTDFDVKGEAFEHFLGDTFTGGLGQYFTPRNVVDFMVAALDPKPGEKVVDPFCGTGGFLIKWHEAVSERVRNMGVAAAMQADYMKVLNTESLYGIDWNERTSLACRMNMTVHGEGQSAKNIYKQSGFEDAIDSAGEIVIGAEMFDVVITNPPFGSAESDPKILDAHALGAGKKSIERAALAMERALALTKPGGWVAIIVMDGILSNGSMKFVREHVRQQAHVRALISLTPETFEGYGGRSNTTVLLLEKRDAPVEMPGEELTFMAMCRNTGYAANGEEIPGNELPEILADYIAWRDKSAQPTGDNTWTAQVRDRLDPSHYWRPVAKEDDGALTEELTKLTAHLIETSRELEAIVREIGALSEGAPTTVYRLGDLLKEVKDTVKVDPNQTYSLLGVRWWGGGAFVREQKVGAEISTKVLQKVTKGNIVYNRLFAYRASFAVVGGDCDGAHASAEFPMYDTRETDYDPVVLKQYVVHALNSPRYLPIVDAESSGSTKTSRNRFRQPEFENFKIAVPTNPDELATLVDLLDKADRVRDRLSGFGTRAKDVRDHFSAIVPGM